MRFTQSTNAGPLPVSRLTSASQVLRLRFCPAPHLRTAHRADYPTAQAHLGWGTYTSWERTLRYGFWEQSNDGKNGADVLGKQVLARLSALDAHSVACVGIDTQMRPTRGPHHATRLAPVPGADSGFSSEVRRPRMKPNPSATNLKRRTSPLRGEEAGLDSGRPARTCRSSP